MPESSDCIIVLSLNIILKIIQFSKNVPKKVVRFGVLKSEKVIRKLSPSYEQVMNR